MSNWNSKFESEGGRWQLPKPRYSTYSTLVCAYIVHNIFCIAVFTKYVYIPRHFWPDDDRIDCNSCSVDSTWIILQSFWPRKLNERSSRRHLRHLTHTSHLDHFILFDKLMQPEEWLGICMNETCFFQSMDPFHLPLQLSYNSYTMFSFQSFERRGANPLTMPGSQCMVWLEWRPVCFLRLTIKCPQDSEGICEE